MLPLFLSLYLRTAGVIEDRIKDRERGQGTLEYVGMIAVAALIVVAVAGAFKGADLGAKVSAAITKVTSVGG